MVCANGQPRCTMAYSGVIENSWTSDVLCTPPSVRTGGAIGVLCDAQEQQQCPAGSVPGCRNEQGEFAPVQEDSEISICTGKISVAQCLLGIEAMSYNAICIGGGSNTGDQASGSSCGIGYLADPSLSSDGHYLVYTATTNPNTARPVAHQIFLYDGTATIEITGDSRASATIPGFGYDPMISGDARYVVFTGVFAGATWENDLVLYDRIAKTYERLGVPGGISQQRLSISTDGGVIAFEHGDCLIVYNRETGKMREMVGNGSTCMRDLTKPKDESQSIFGAQGIQTLDVSGDGKFIAYTADYNGYTSPGEGTKAVYVADPASNSITAVAHAIYYTPVFLSEDGKTLAYLNNVDGGNTKSVLLADVSNPLNVTRTTLEAGPGFVRTLGLTFAGMDTSATIFALGSFDLAPQVRTTIVFNKQSGAKTIISTEPVELTLSGNGDVVAFANLHEPLLLETVSTQVITEVPTTYMCLAQREASCDQCIAQYCTTCTGSSSSKDSSSATPVCGNGKVEGTETCDDANTLNGDCCTNCQIDQGCVCKPRGSSSSSISEGGSSATSGATGGSWLGCGAACRYNLTDVCWDDYDIADASQTNFHAQGAVNLDGIIFKDRCENSMTVAEQACVPYPMKREEKFRVCSTFGESCVDGACVAAGMTPQPVTEYGGREIWILKAATCSNFDSGLIHANSKGSITFKITGGSPAVTYEDTCVSTGLLDEFGCRSDNAFGMYATIIRTPCSPGKTCSDGACR